MRSYGDELKSKNFNLIYKDVNKDFKLSYEKKLEKIIKEKKIKEISFFEIEDKNNNIFCLWCFSKVQRS